MANAKLAIAVQLQMHLKSKVCLAFDFDFGIMLAPLSRLHFMTIVYGS